MNYEVTPGTGHALLLRLTGRTGETHGRRGRAQHPADREPLYPAVGWRAGGGEDLAARGCRAEPGAGDPGDDPLSQARRDASTGMSACIRGSPPKAMPACASISAAAANPKACSRDEYLPREQQDGVEIIDWLARQNWCSGKVGMTGISWGGFNALQVAALKPPALKAIITLCSTDDRYADDIHYMGGCLHQRESLLERRPLHLGRPAARSAARRRRIGGRSGWRGWRRTAPGSSNGSPISAATLIGSRAPSARITAPSIARSMRSAAGRTAIPTPCRGCWRV